jgi:hypothetical protein
MRSARITRRIARVCLAGAAAFCFSAGLLAPECVQAQMSVGSSTRGTTTSGMFGSTTLGGGTTSNTQAAQQSGAKSGTLGGGTMAGQGGLQVYSPAGSQGNGAFVGASTSNISNFFSRQSGNTQPRQTGLANIGNLLNLSRQNTFNQQQTQRNAQRGRQQAQSPTLVRVPIRVGFQPPPITGTQFTTAFSERLAKMPGLLSSGRIEVSLEGRTAVLRGTVPSDSDRQLAERLAYLEPEVAQVRNELIVGTPPPAPAEPLPTP